MSYLLDKKNKQKRLIRNAIIVCILFFVFYFRINVFSLFASVGHTVFKPFLFVSSAGEDRVSNVWNFLGSKNNLIKENEDLHAEINTQKAKLVNYDSVLEENTRLKEILERKSVRDKMVLGAILAKPNRSPYDTLIIDVGTNDGVKVGDTVFALGNVPVGKVAITHNATSNVVLFSTNKETTDAILSGQNIFMQLVGRGGGNFEMILPRDLELENGAEVVLPGINPYTIAVVKTVISDPRDSFTKALLVSPVNIQELKFVEIKIQ